MTPGAALVIEGGANRAAYATGALAVLQARGFVPDAVYGTSAGGALAAWYGAGQMEQAVRTWTYATDRRILSYRRAFVGRPILDLHVLYHDIYPNTFKIDLDALRRAPFPVVVTLTDADSGATEYVDLRKVDEPLRWIHGGAALPIAAEAPVTLGGRRFLDGGTTDPIPLRKAIDDGHKTIVVVLNRTKGVRGPEPAWAVRLFARRFPHLEKAARDHHVYHNEAVALAESPPPGVRVRLIRPTRDTGLTRVTRDLEVIDRAIAQGRRDAEFEWAKGGW